MYVNIRAILVSILYGVIISLFVSSPVDLGLDIR